MSVNSSITQSYLAEVEALKDMVSSFVTERESAQTLEEKALVESKAIGIFERLIDFDYKLKEIKPGDYPEMQTYNDFYYEYYQVMQIAMSKLRVLIDLFARHFNSQQYVLADLIGKLKRVRQKRAALALWNNEESKFILSEKFFNLDHLNTKFTSFESCYVESAEGVLTLPVRERTPITVNTVRIGSGSNGFAGNSDVAVTFNNIDPEFSINGNPNNWFEYERLDSGPLDLTLIVEFTKPEILNNIAITPINVGQVYSYVVEDIVFTSNGQTLNLTEVAGPIDTDRKTVKSVGNDSDWSLTFLPIQAKTIAIKFKQVQSYGIDVLNANRAVVQRQRFCIGIQKLSFSRLRYESAGGINSVERSLQAGLYAAEPTVSVWPPAPEFFDALLEVSFDGGENWKPAENLDDGIGSTLLMEGTESNLLWRIAITRDNEAIGNATTFLPVNSAIREVGSSMRPVSKFVSPIKFNLPEKPARGDVFAIQPNVARKGNRLKAIAIGNSVGGESRFPLPFPVLSSSISPEEMHVYVNGVEYDYQIDDYATGANEWSLSDDFQEIIFSSDLPDKAKIFAVFDEERMLVEKRSDGFYHQMGMLFDPDKDNIEIKFFPREPVQVTKLLPRDQTVIDLGYTNIESDSFRLNSLAGTSYVEVSTRAALVATTDAYFLDPINGNLWLKSQVGSDIVRATFNHQNSETISNEDYDIVYEEQSVKPWGVRISPSAFEVKSGNDEVGLPITAVMDPIFGTLTTAPDAVSGATDAFKLSYNYVIKGTVQVSSDMFDVAADPVEVDFIDGRTEFFGLIFANTEQTTETVADGTGLVTFRLAAGALYYKDFGVSFGNTTVFNSRVANVGLVSGTGEYHIADDGTVTVYVGSGNSLEGGISIAYSYRNPDFEPSNKYSVDYKKGIFYGGSDLNMGATVKYKASSYKVSYNIARQIDNYSYNSSGNFVNVRTEGIDNINRLVKVIWAKESSRPSLISLKEYFSPIFSTLAFRFT